MKPSKESILEAAMQLSTEEQLEVAATLQDRAMPFFDDPEVEAAWGEETKGRLDEIDQGNVDLIPWEQVRDEMRKITDDPQS